MKHFTKSLLVMAALLMGSTPTMWADDIDLSNFELVRSVTWGGETDITRNTESALTIKAFETGNNRQQTLYAVTAPADAAGWIGVQATNSQDGKGWWNRPGQGLWSYNATRSAAVYGDDLTAGWVVVFTCSDDVENVMTLTNGDGQPDGPFTYQKSDDGKSYYCTITGTSNAYVGFCGNKSKGYIKEIAVYKPEGEKVLHSITWGEGDDITRDTETKLSITAYETGNKKQQTLYPVTAPADAVGWIGVQLTLSQDSKGWTNREGYGMWSYNAARSAAIYGEDLTAGVQVIFTCTDDAANVMTLTNGDGQPDGPFTYVKSEDGKQYICTITAESNGYVGFCGNRSKGYIKEIKVIKPSKTAVLTTYTLKYVDTNGNELKESTTVNGISGNTAALSTADKANIVVDGTTYVYESDNTEGNPIAEDGSTVITIVFHAAQNLDYKVNEVAAGNIVRTTEGTGYETESINVPFHKYNVVDGTLYHKDAINKEYNYYFNLTTATQEVNLDYAATETTNVVFLSEGEDIEGLTPCNSANTAIRSSNSASAYATADTKIVTLSAGTYKLTAFIYDASKSPDSHWIFKAGDTQIADLNCTTVNIQELSSEEFTLTAPTTIYMAQGGGNNMGLDLIYITGDGSVVETPESNVIAFEITDPDGYATYFNSQKAFIMPEGVKGGVISAVSGKTSMLKYVYEAGSVVPAGTPIILNGEPKAYEAEVTTLTGTAPEENMLCGYDEFTEKEASSNDYYFYKLSRGTENGESVVAFYWFNEDGHANESKPNKAYLRVPAENAANIAIYLDETTGIHNMTAISSDNSVYTLSGIRVDGKKLAKGVYVINGKKTVVR